MFSTTAARLAHEARIPLLRFPTKAARQNRPSSPLSLSASQLTPDAAPHHAPSPHPCAPQAAIDAFPAFLARLQGAASGGAATTAPKSGSKLPQAEYEGEWEMPARFRREAYSPSEAEIEAVEVREVLRERRRELMSFGRAAEWRS